MSFIAYLKTQFIVHLLLGFVFVVSGFCINFIQLCTLPIWPINKQLYRHLNCRLAYSLWSQLVLLLEWWSGTECTLFTDQATVDQFGKEHVIVILNHNFEIDFLCGWAMCERHGVLGSSKVLAKKELLYVPLIGWTWYFLEIVFCKRRWDEDRDTVVNGLKALQDYPEYMWFLLYCEGTRFTEKKHRISMEVAESKGLPKLKYHLLPRTKGFTTTVKYLRGTVTAVYDVTLNFRDNKNPTLLGILHGKQYHADMCVRRFPLEDIPEDEKECAAWLHRLYQEKDALQEQYVKDGTFPGEAIQPRRRPWAFLNWLFWVIVLLTPLFNFVFGVFVSGSPIVICSFLLFVGAASFSVRRLIGVTEIGKGSSYGNQEFKKRM
ncbi:1-acyl-sn-glycerol-3-phosphate acyltransferase gamma [Chiloscyllium plagiosum]|uniref:1-acyl-sn-glycerol-3-phosphate acyltransferase gamma n=1 Tax=Chiloscyllium plagiosum TaxID=36176 RepID=UPI001CB7CB37|nr:1-acyl-sn-glycerol-3-phosphate acyltransferase gamma [Chiloscyllium plagiosum]XP_043557370.1 1-acyl-sn-glycerol-3-phosphate acyltransferase gamma [Chiloscyllium plagiosum]XP_043557371.1 1-acyl-sn-glycerol-3-phosphate acyltransferase gamma [Chiloscyllium plagiosum]XP_043557372.1 1-acyl-sn-glycerol-3-phosphate acyltransferase gamma [Chiloscyllium plagiosum]